MKIIKFLSLVILCACGSQSDPVPSKGALPNVTTIVKDVTSTSVTVGGNITSDGGLFVVERGVVINNIIITIGKGTGEFTVGIDLNPLESYTVKSFARNFKGVKYGDAISFIANCISDIGGMIQYSTVPMTSANPISSCPLITGTTTFSEAIEGKYYVSDITFGFYGCVWYDSPQSLWLIHECGQLRLEGHDQYGAKYEWLSVSVSGNNLIIHWQNELADEATTTLTRSGGWAI